MENKENNSKVGWYLLFLSIGGVTGIVVWNTVGWIF